MSVGDQASAKVKRPRKTRSRSAPAQPTPSSPPTVLLSVAGLSPQVITETLYCLMKSSGRPEPIREIRVVTTQAGDARIRESLLRPRDGWFHRFCRDFRIPPGSIRFNSSCILVPKGQDGKPLQDVRTPADNALVADCILTLVRNLTRDPDTALHCSVAGGRKTMGLLLGIAFQLFARPGDCLSHVLVWPPEMEGSSEFFYLPPRPTTYAVDGRTIRSRDIRVELAEIPVLLLRERVATPGLETQSYTGLIAQAQQELDRLTAPPRLTLDLPSRSLRITDKLVSLTPVEFGLYHLLAQRRAAGCGQGTCPGCPRCAFEAREFLDPSVLRDIRDCLVRIGVRDERARSLPGWRSAGDQRFLEVRSKINAKIRRALGSGHWVDRYCIVVLRGLGPLARYRIPIDPSQIVIG